MNLRIDTAPYRNLTSENARAIYVMYRKASRMDPRVFDGDVLMVMRCAKMADQPLNWVACARFVCDEEIDYQEEAWKEREGPWR
jgi:hypothetical protein